MPGTNAGAASLKVNVTSLPHLDYGDEKHFVQYLIYRAIIPDPDAVEFVA